MQRVNIRMGHTIDNMYSFNYNISRYNGINPRQLNYELNNPFQRFFKVSLRGNHVEIPVFASYMIQYRLSTVILLNDDILKEDIIIPFSCTNIANTYRTSDALVKYLTGSLSTRQNMYFSARTNKGEKYYGCSGTLFNKDMIPIFISVLVGDIENSVLTYKKIRTYIHPSVFYSNGIVEKCIVNKIIPYVMQNGVPVNIERNYTNIQYNISLTGVKFYRRAIPEIVVADVGDRFFCKPVLPSVLYTNDSINDTLNENIDDVFKIMEI